MGEVMFKQRARSVEGRARAAWQRTEVVEGKGFVVEATSVSGQAASGQAGRGMRGDAREDGGQLMGNMRHE